MWTSIKAIAITFTLAFALTAGLEPASAAPQVLALIQSDGKIDLTCNEGKCSAEFSSFCLQSDRFSPRAGTRYNLVGDADIQLHGITREGLEIALDAAKYLKFESIRTHLAVRASVPEAEMARLGLVKVTMSVGKHASLAPAPVPGDSNPLTELKIRFAADSLRQVGAGFIDANGGRMAAAHITGRLINRLPQRGNPDLDELPDLWRGALNKPGTAAPKSGAERMARDALNFCEFAVRRNNIGNLRRCLQTQHDAFINFLNAEYWQAIRTGS